MDWYTGARDSSRAVSCIFSTPAATDLELRDPTWSAGMPELSVDELAQQA